MTQLAKDFTEWYKKAAIFVGTSNPEDVLHKDGKDMKNDLDAEYLEALSPIPDFEYIDMYRDYSDMNCIIKIGDRHLMLSGYYDSWNGTTWEDYEWVEVEQKERVEKYWSGV